MTYKTHMAGAVCLMLLVSNQVGLDLKMTFLSAAVASVGGILPDLDYKKSTISKKLKITSAIVRKFSKHRGIMHTPILWMIIGLLFALTPYSYLWVPAVVIGALSHILLDALNPRGVPMLWPIYTKKIRFLRIVTGSNGETVIYLLLMIANTIWIIYIFIYWLLSHS